VTFRQRDRQILATVVHLSWTRFPSQSVSDGRFPASRRHIYVLPRRWFILWAANRVGPSRSRKSTRPGANGVVDLSRFEFLDRLADLVPPLRKHRRRYHGVFAPNHKLRRAITSLAIGNVGKSQEAVTGGYAAGGRATGGAAVMRIRIKSPARTKRHGLPGPS